MSRKSEKLAAKCARGASVSLHNIERIEVSERQYLSRREKENPEETTSTRHIRFYDARGKVVFNVSVFSGPVYGRDKKSGKDIRHFTKGSLIVNAPWHDPDN